MAKKKQHKDLQTTSKTISTIVSIAIAIFGAGFWAGWYIHGNVSSVEFHEKEMQLYNLHRQIDEGYKDALIRCTPKRVLTLLDKVGGYDKLVLAHYGGNELFGEVYEVLAGEDVYFDTAYILGSIKTDEFMRILEKHGEDKILFASDSPWQDIGVSVERIRSFALPKECEEKI